MNSQQIQDIRLMYEAVYSDKLQNNILEENQEIDIFDYLLEYLVAEGYVDTNQDALVMMANMNKEEIDSILIERRREDKGKQRSPEPSDAFKIVSKSMGSSRAGVQPRGKKKVPGQKPPAAGEYGGPRSPEQKVKMRRDAEQRAKEAQSSRFD